MSKKLLKDLEQLEKETTKKLKEAKTNKEYQYYLGKLDLIKMLLLVRY